MSKVATVNYPVRGAEFKRLSLPERMRIHGITVLGQCIIDAANPPGEAFLVYERMINQLFAESLPDALLKDLNDLESRISHLETNREVKTIAQAADKRARDC